jgi:hypothetical protein
MNQQPDKLFKEKLEGFSKAVPASAWNRVEAGLNKKKNNGLWLKVAASLLVLAVAAILLWPAQTREKQSELTAEKNVPDKKTEPARKSESHPVQDSAITPLEEKSHQAFDSKKVRKAYSKKQPRKNLLSPVTERPEEKSRVQEISITEVPKEKIAVIEEPLIPVSLETSAATASAGEETGVTLVYTAEEVNAKYLDKKSLAEATSNEKKPSTLRKLLDKAYDLKHNQDPFADLRQKKNEILALNFKGEKQRSQNK